MKKLGVKTGLLGFGGMRFPQKDGEIDREKSKALLEKAHQEGVNYFDTAIVYHGGKSEAFMGSVMSEWDRDSYFIATKLTIGIYKDVEEIKQAIDIQLSNLKTDRIDFYLIHAMGKNRLEQLKAWNVMPILEEWKRLGKIRHIGFSFHDSYDVFLEILDFYDWDFCQIQLNYIDQDIQQGIQGYYELERRNIPCIVMEPVKGGKLAKFHPEIETIFKEKNPDDSVASWAMRWVGSLKGVNVILSGMTENYQLEDNLKTFHRFTPLDEDERRRIDQVREELLLRTKVGCTSCQYCMPCPLGVDIPHNFELYNENAMFGDTPSDRYFYHLLKSKNADATHCVECGECIPKCPQKIDIPKELASMKNDMKVFKNDGK